jgi:hypothetical protein
MATTDLNEEVITTLFMFVLVAASSIDRTLLMAGMTSSFPFSLVS